MLMLRASAFFVLFFGCRLNYGRIYSVSANAFDAFLAAVLFDIALADSDDLTVYRLESESEFS